MIGATLDALDDSTIALVRLAAAIAGSDEAEVRDSFAQVVSLVPAQWVEELVIQSYLFSGFPRALNAAREWRRVAPTPAPPTDEGDDVTHVDEWRQHGEETCAAVYGPMYEQLRINVRRLHPALDAAMVIEGYGKILSRPGLDLPRRELCIVAACAMTGQDRQLHSHLHGALNVGVAPAVLSATVDALLPQLGEERTRSVRLLLARVLGK
ncbi:MAG: carboxymuconolactone decarboxylase family protein [Gemmatimonadaceae bacterium]